jgi:phosphoglycerate kinase
LDILYKITYTDKIISTFLQQSHFFLNFALQLKARLQTTLNKNIEIMMTIDKFNFAGKKAIVRVDFNVPLNEEGKITDDTRIRGALPTLKKILADGGALIIMSHMGKPKGKVNAKYSLSQIVDAVAAALGTPVKFAPDCAKAQDAAAALKPGEVLLLENLRFYPEEEGKPVGIEKEDPAYEDAKKEMKARQKEFAKTLASYADCYVMDAFGTAHRKHASTAVIADYFDADHKMLGYLMEKEVKAVDNVLKDIKRPFTAIMGGSKVSTKIGIIENLMDKVDNLILCGGMAFTFAKAQGGKIGNSLVEDDKLDLALDIIAKAKAKGVNLVLGCDCIAADKFANDANTQVCDDKNIPDGWMGLDAGPKTREEFKEAIKGAKTILWNGPAGVFEFDNFAGGSKAIAEAIAEATKEGAFSLIGGGDSVACINKFGMADQVSYISTGGGALLEAIEGKVLPGIAAIRGDK